MAHAPWGVRLAATFSAEQGPFSHFPAVPAAPSTQPWLPSNTQGPPLARQCTLPMQVEDGSAICHDLTTRLPEKIPLATTVPTTCAEGVIISPLTTLLAYGPAGLDAAMVKRALGLDEGIRLGVDNVYRVSERAMHECVGGESEGQARTRSLACSLVLNAVRVPPPPPLPPHADGSEWQRSRCGCL